MEKLMKLNELARSVGITKELDDKMLNLPKGGEGTFTLAFSKLNEIINDIKGSDKI